MRKKVTDLKPRSRLIKAINDKLVGVDTIGAFYSNPKDTTLAAALRVKTGTQRRAIYDAIWESPDGLTDEEIVELTKIRPNSEHPRRWELAGNDGFPVLIADSGRRRRLTTGYRGAVWVPVDGT
jgi:hypothetical protein